MNLVRSLIPANVSHIVFSFEYHSFYLPLFDVQLQYIRSISTHGSCPVLTNCSFSGLLVKSILMHIIAGWLCSIMMDDTNRQDPMNRIRDVQLFVSSRFLPSPQILLKISMRTSEGGCFQRRQQFPSSHGTVSDDSVCIEVLIAMS